MRKNVGLTIMGAFLFFVKSNAQQTFPYNGVRDEKHLLYAYTHATIHTDYKTVIEDGTIIFQDGVIKQVGKSITPPAEATTVDLKGKHIYPSFIDVFTDYGMPEIKRGGGGQDPQFLSNTKGAYNWNQAIKPEFDAKTVFTFNSAKAEEMRKMGFGVVQSFQKDGIARGASVVVSLGDGKEQMLIVKEMAGAHYSFDKGSSTQDYPSSLMGSIALLRQSYYDAQWYKSGGSNAEKNLSLQAWNDLQSIPQFFDAGDKQTVLRADKLGDEFGVQYIIKTSGDEYERIAEIKSTGAKLIVPLNFPIGYEVDDPYDAMNITLSELKRWELAPGNAAALEKAGVQFALTLADLKNKGDFWKNIRKAIQYGLTSQQALKALTATPAEMLGIQQQAGALKVGMMANILVTADSIFSKSNTIYSNWIQGKEYRINPMDIADYRGKYNLTIGNELYTMVWGGELANPELTIKKDTTKLKASFTRIGNTFNIQFALKDKKNGNVYLTGLRQGNSIKGNGQINGSGWLKWTADFVSKDVIPTVPDTAKTLPLQLGTVSYPNMSYGWKTLPVAGSVLIKNATVWTNEQAGILKNTDVLIQNGKIIQIGKGLKAADASCMQVDGTNKHLTAGIIDEHSHIAISRGVNEGTQAVTSEVRIGDVINAEDINIYRQLSGGVTTSHLLHGSANPIGGQTTLIKLRWGKAPEQLKFEGADGFIKFALGENVKQSNWGDRQVVRFPQTRMGVEQVFIDAFSNAKEYQRMWKDAGKAAVKPRRNLELDALVEILEKKRFITCHSYVQSEINMLMHVADSMGFTVNTFTHILEGYKLADKMKKHGANASTFADWWAYKIEVAEAIPFNAAILNKMGVNTSINSDDAEMARRLNQEAAKSVKYGGLTEEEALKLCTLNPAKMLHIDNKVGSIKVGKDADVVLWTDNPLSVYAKVEKTFVDGIPYFDADTDKQLREQNKQERARLIQKMAEAKLKGESTQKATKTFEVEYNCDTLGEEGELK